MKIKRTLQLLNGELVHFEAELLQSDSLQVLVQDCEGKPSVLLQMEHVVNWLNFELPMWADCQDLEYYYKMPSTKDGQPADPYYFEVRVSKGLFGIVDFFRLEPLREPPRGFEPELPAQRREADFD